MSGWVSLPWAANRPSLGWEGESRPSPARWALGQQNLAETKEILDIPQFNILSFAFGLARHFAWRF